MFCIDFSLPNPRQMNDSKSLRLLSMPKQNIITISTVGKRFDGPPEKQVAGWQFTLKLSVQTLGLPLRGNIPTVR